MCLPGQQAECVFFEDWTLHDGFRVWVSGLSVCSANRSTTPTRSAGFRVSGLGFRV